MQQNRNDLQVLSNNKTAFIVLIPWIGEKNIDFSSDFESPKVQFIKAFYSSLLHFLYSIFSETKNLRHSNMNLSLKLLPLLRMTANNGEIVTL